MFELLGLSLLLAALLTFNSAASLIISFFWRAAGGMTDGWSAANRARFLFFLRTFPVLIALLFVAFLLVPAYLVHEPRHTDESVSLKLGLLAALSATGLAVSFYRAYATQRATARLTSDWLRQGKPVQIDGINVKSYEIQHQFPLIGIVGFFRPRLFIARQVLELLTPEEIAAAIAHEKGHLSAHDNLKRGVLQACRDALLIIPSGRSLDKAWSEASEEAADENAARQGHGVALDLASALVKIARIIPLGARPTMPAGVFLLGVEESKGILSRVRRLIALAANDDRHTFTFSSLFVWVPATVLVIGFVAAALNPAILAAVHVLIEHAVSALS